MEWGATLPEDPAIRFYAYYKCKNTVDVLADNAAKIAKNVEKMRGHRDAKNAWDASKVSGGEVRVGYCGETCERAPKMPIMERIPIVCHCIQMRNPNPKQWDDPASTCPIKCTNLQTGERYIYDAVKRKVTCPSCLCSCTAAFEASAYQDITVAQTVDKVLGVITIHKKEVKSSSELMATILSQSADAAFRCASQVMVNNGIVMS